MFSSMEVPTFELGNMLGGTKESASATVIDLCGPRGVKLPAESSASKRYLASVNARSHRGYRSATHTALSGGAQLVF